MKTFRGSIKKKAVLMKARCVLLILFVMPAALFFTVVTPLRASDRVIEILDDATINTRVKISLLYHLSLNFQVHTSDGVVTLSGNASSVAEKDLNAKLAAEIKGVKNVINNMVAPVSVVRSN